MFENLGSRGRKLRVCVAGASGGIGKAFVSAFENQENVETVYCLSRKGISSKSDKIVSINFDLTDESSIKAAAHAIGTKGELDVLVIATGMLHSNDVMPEKDWRQLQKAPMAELFAVNTIGPAMLMARFSELLPKDSPSLIAALSARVGSISDNRLGGWYSYRASKAALNQIIKTFSIELARKRKQAVIIGLHPGTVDTDLSKPFQGSFQDRFTPEQSVEKLLQVLDGLNQGDSGNVLDWNGKTVPA